ncbi:hypothetical protein PIROE2DRAFT_63535 [Piromyces sp. E2]|nr:hypothetical protein PIROE2DRAFT_63535 [Piromyces sp. E2]|eukprot:OUM59800.1 hypothetical protein PIROE2DRAFT_63535 [Piromyces sp. E2]
MSIFLCNESHIKELVEFYEEEIDYLEKTVNYPEWIRGGYPSEETITAAVKAGHQYGYSEDGKIVGAVVLNDEPGGKYENANVACKRKEYLVIHTLATSHKCYKKGIATKIVHFCIEKAKEGGYKGIYTDIIPSNTLSKNLFTKLGFKCLGTFDLERHELLKFYAEVPPFTVFELVF